MKKSKKKKIEIKTTPGFEEDLKKLFSLDPIYLIPRLWNNFKYEIKWAYQRVVRGYDDRWYWSFNHRIADIGIDVFKHMSKNVSGYPGSISYKKWQKILMKISEGFKAYKEIQEHDSYMIPTGYYHEDGILKGTEKMVINKKKLKELQRKQKRGLVLFAKWFNHIWD